MKKISLLTLNLFLASLFLTSNIFPDFLNYGDTVYLRSFSGYNTGNLDYLKKNSPSSDYFTTNTLTEAEKFIICKSQSEIGSGPIKTGNIFVLKTIENDKSSQFLNFRDNGGWITRADNRFMAIKSSNAIKLKVPSMKESDPLFYSEKQLSTASQYSLRAVDLTMGQVMPVCLWQNGNRFQFNVPATQFKFEKTK